MNCIYNLGTWHFLWQKVTEQEERERKNRKTLHMAFMLSLYPSISLMSYTHSLTQFLLVFLYLFFFSFFFPCCCCCLCCYIMAIGANVCQNIHITTQHSTTDIIHMYLCALALESNGIHMRINWCEINNTKMITRNANAFIMEYRI